VARVFTLEYPPGTPVLNINRHKHWRVTSPVTRDLRTLTAILARKQEIPALGQVHVRVWYFPPDRRRRDSPNVTFWTSKACIDGLVDAGVLADDCDRVIRSLDLRPGDTVIKGGRLVIELEELEGHQ
jgi:crossover junction endodeoxyribonuclease RusA